MIEPTANRTFRFVADWFDHICPTGWTGGDVVRPPIREIRPEIVPTRRVVSALAVVIRPVEFYELKLHQVKVAARELG